MFIQLFNWFVKITAWPVQYLCMRTKIGYEDRKVQGRAIRGPAILISNHTSVYDYAAYLFVFPGRTLRFQMAEVLFTRPGLGLFLRLLGGIRVDREAHDFGFMIESEDILNRGGVVGIFPEGRLHETWEDPAVPLEFKPGAAYLALATGVPVIPVVTNGSYFRKKRARVLIGKPFTAASVAPEGADERETIRAVSEAMREKIISLEKQLDERENG